MQNEETIRKRIDEILKDNRLHYKTADITINAPLALIQLQMEVELHALEQVLEIPLTNIKKLRGEVE